MEDFSRLTFWEVHITAHGSRLRNDLYCVEWDVKLYYTIPYLLVQRRAEFKGGPGGGRPPTNRGPPTKQFISYFSLMIDAYETTT